MYVLTLMYFIFYWSIIALLEFAQVHVHRIGDAIKLSHPLPSPSPPAFNLSLHQGLFQWVNSSHQVAKVLELQFQHQSFQWIFRTDFLEDGLVWPPCCPRLSRVSPTQQFKTSILQLSAFFMVQISHWYITTWKAIALTRWTFVSKVISLLCNMLSRLVISFLPGSKPLNFLAAVTICSDFGAPKSKVCLCFHCFPNYLPWSDRTGCHDLCFLTVEF